MNQLNKDVSDLFTKGSHHLNVSVIFILQNVFHQSPVMRNISLNSHYMILLKNPRDRAQVRHHAQQLYMLSNYTLPTLNASSKHIKMLPNYRMFI